jgi:large subunit ribosomal protein L33
MITKNVRKIITMECLACKSNLNKYFISRYTTSKNKFNTPNRLDLKKFCGKCKKHTQFREIK